MSRQGTQSRTFGATLTNFLLVLILSFGFMACSDPTVLDRDRAEELLVENNAIIDTNRFQITLNNEYTAANFKKLSLEKEGYWRLNTQATAKNGLNIQFTEKAKPYLSGDIYSQTERISLFTYRTIKFQRVVVSYHKLKEVTGIRKDPSGTKALVECTYELDGKTPFFELLEKTNPSAQQEKKNLFAFRLYDDGWRIVSNPGPEFVF